MGWCGGSEFLDEYCQALWNWTGTYFTGIKALLNYAKLPLFHDCLDTIVRMSKKECLQADAQ